MREDRRVRLLRGSSLLGSPLVEELVAAGVDGWWRDLLLHCCDRVKWFRGCYRL